MEDRSLFDIEAPKALREVRYGDVDDQVMDVVGHVPKGARPIALLHGGFWRPAFDRAHLRPLTVALADKTAVYNVEYRRVPGEPMWQFDDVCAALARITELEGRSPVVIGHSAGGHLALLAAIHRPDLVHACIAVAPVSDLGAAEARGDGNGAVAEFLGGSAADHIMLDPARLPRPTVPWVVLHGDDDIRVPVDMSHAYHDAVVTHEVGHFEWMDPRTDAAAHMIERAWGWADAPERESAQANVSR